MHACMMYSFMHACMRMYTCVHAYAGLGEIYSGWTRTQHCLRSESSPQSSAPISSSRSAVPIASHKVVHARVCALLLCGSVVMSARSRYMPVLECAKQVHLQ